MKHDGLAQESWDMMSGACVGLKHQFTLQNVIPLFRVLAHLAFKPVKLTSVHCTKPASNEHTVESRLEMSIFHTKQGFGRQLLLM